MTPNKAAFIGFLLVLPFTLANFIVQWKPEPFYSALESIRMLTEKPWLPTVLLMLFPIAFFVTIRPMLHRRTCGYHRFYPLNAALGALILAATIFLWNGLGQDIIACDILKIPNCD